MRLTITPVLVLSAAALSAQWTSNTAVNTSVRSGAGVDAATPLMSDGPDGSTYVSWFDNQPGGYQLRMQRLDENGYPLWPAEGLLVSDHPQNSALFRYDLAADSQGNAIVAFQDERSGQLDIVAYKISPSGDMLWGADGIALTDAGATQGLGPVIGVQSNDDVVIAWNANDGGSGKWIAYQSISADGVPQWAAPHQVIGTAKYSRPKVIRTLDGFLLFYVEETGNFPFTSNMYVQRYDATGSPVWSMPTHVSSKTVPVFYFPAPIPDGNNGMYLAFNTGNPDNASLTDVYVQRVKADGSAWSTTGTEVLTGTSTQRFGGTLALMNTIMGLLVPVQVTNAAQSEGGWNVQLVDTNGVAQLGPAGVEVVAQSAQLASPDDCAALSDGCIVVYSEGGFGQEHIKATRLGFLGWQTWGGPINVCSMNSNKDDVSCGRMNNNGQVVAVWQDDRVGSGVFAQNILANGSVGPVGIARPEATNGRMTVHESADGTVLEIGAGPAGPEHIDIMDITGRAIWTKDVAEGRAGAMIVLPTELLSVGTYVVRVATPGQSTSITWVRH